MTTQTLNEFAVDVNGKITGARLAEAIQGMADAMRELNNTRLNRKCLVGLIHLQSKLPRKDIEIVLNNLEAFEEIWLKPKEDLPV